jgi:predicted RNase H-like HicB family nuclease
MKFAIIIEKGETNYGAYAPDIPGCVGLGAIPERARKDLLNGLAAHLRLMAQDGDPMPVAASTVDYIDIDLPAKPMKRARKPRGQTVG